MFIELEKNHVLHCEITGPKSAAETIVLLNGSVFNLHQWDLLLARGFRRSLSKRYRIVRYDYGRIGRSSAPGRFWSLPQLVDELILLIDKLALPSVHLFGLSKGTCVLQLAGLHRPDRIRSLAGYGWYNPAYSKLERFNTVLTERLRNFERLSSLGEEPLDRRSFHELWSKVYRPIVFPGSLPSATLFEKLRTYLLKRRLFRMIAPTPPRVMYDWFSYALDGMTELAADYHSKLKALAERPVLLMHASFDKVLPVEMARELHEAWPSARYIEYEGPYTHISPAFRPKQAAAIIDAYASFLRELP
jgi:pimeloyl-ACP methyl ester carboxylesterase